MYDKNKLFNFLPWIIPCVVIIAWSVNAFFEIVPNYLIPSPKQIIKAAKIYVFDATGSSPYAGRFLSDMTVSLGRVFLGFILAVFIGVPLGLWSGRSSVLSRILNTTVNSIRAVPGIAWLPLAIVWFGIGTNVTIFLIALAAFFPIYTNSFVGGKQVEVKLIRAGAMLGVDRFQSFIHIVLPASMPYLVPGLRLGLAVSWAYLVLGELTGVQNGLGALIMDARMVGRVDLIIVGIISIATIGKLSDIILISGLKRFFLSVRRIVK